MHARGSIVGNGAPPYGTLGGALNVHAADVHHVVVNELFHFHTGIASTLAVASTAGDRTVTLADATAFTVGSRALINSGSEARILKILAKSVNDLTFDQPLDVDHPIGEPIEVVDVNMNVVASAVAPRIFVFKPHDNTTVWHMTRMLLGMTHATAGDMGLFGNQAALTNGVLIRDKTNGVVRTLTNWKTNADIERDMYDLRFDSRAGGGGTFGTSGRGSFSRLGAVLRLDGALAEQVEVVIQDDLSGLTEFLINGQGHVEGE